MNRIEAHANSRTRPGTQTGAVRCDHVIVCVNHCSACRRQPGRRVVVDDRVADVGSTTRGKKATVAALNRTPS